MKWSYWIYGGCVGLLLLIMEILHYKTMIRDVKLEVFGGVIALLFTVLGLGLGYILVQRNKDRKIRRPAGNINKLSIREIDVLELLAQGHSNQEIADQLFVSLNTIKTHLASIYQKLDVSRRTQAIQKAYELGVLIASEIPKR